MYLFSCSLLESPELNHSQSTSVEGLWRFFLFCYLWVVSKGLYNLFSNENLKWKQNLVSACSSNVVAALSPMSLPTVYLFLTELCMSQFRWRLLKGEGDFGITFTGNDRVVLQENPARISSKHAAVLGCLAYSVAITRASHLKPVLHTAREARSIYQTGTHKATSTLHVSNKMQTSDGY